MSTVSVLYFYGHITHRVQKYFPSGINEGKPSVKDILLFPTGLKSLFMLSTCGYFIRIATDMSE